MDERWIGALSTAGVIVGLAVMQALPRPAAAKVQEGAKWFIAATLVVGGAAYWEEQGHPFLFILAVLTVGAWLVRRLVVRRRRQRQAQPQPARQFEHER